MKLYLKNRVKTADAICEYSDGQFKILKGSKIDLSSSKTKISKSALVARNDRSIVDSNGVLKKDITFKSATTSAQFVIGQSINGKRIWKDKEGEKVLLLNEKK